MGVAVYVVPVDVCGIASGVLACLPCGLGLAGVVPVGGVVSALVGVGACGVGACPLGGEVCGAEAGGVLGEVGAAVGVALVAWDV